MVGTLSSLQCCNDQLLLSCCSLAATQVSRACPVSTARGGPRGRGRGCDGEQASSAASQPEEGEDRKVATHPSNVSSLSLSHTLSLSGLAPATAQATAQASTAAEATRPARGGRRGSPPFLVAAKPAPSRARRLQLRLLARPLALPARAPRSGHFRLRRRAAPAQHRRALPGGAHRTQLGLLSDPPPT